MLRLIALLRQNRFTHDQWAFIQTQADLLTEKSVHRCISASVHRRLRFALRFFYTTGLRLAECVQSRCDDLKRVEYPDPDTGGVTRLHDPKWWRLTIGPINAAQF
jgi:integrase